LVQPIIGFQLARAADAVSLFLFGHNGIRLSVFAARDGSHLDTMLTMTDQPSAIAGRPAWRVTALGEADRLDAQLASALPASDSAAPLSPRVDAIRQAIDGARTVAKGKSSRGLVDWWYGTSIESAWQALHRAQEELVMVLPADELRAEAPHLRELVQETFTGERQKTESAAIDALNADSPDRLAARRVLGAYHAKSDAQHQRVRALRNLLYLLFIGLTAIALGLWGTGVTSGEIVGLGALAGALSVVFAVRAGSPSGPYNLMLPQALLKVAAGSATALAAVEILDVINGATVTAARDSMYAIVFGFSQQAFTRLVDQQAGALAKGPDPRSGGTAPPPSAKT
jgi:predicted RNA-binding Zn ribbon-like protein